MKIKQTVTTVSPGLKLNMLRINKPFKYITITFEFYSLNSNLLFSAFAFSGVESEGFCLKLLT